MHIVTPKHLNRAAQSYPDAAAEIIAWAAIVKQVRWQSFIEVRQTFSDADAVGGFVVFNVRRNRYRLITVIHYAGDREGTQTMGHVYIRAFLTHREYDNRSNWDKEFGR